MGASGELGRDPRAAALPAGRPDTPSGHPQHAHGRNLAMDSDTPGVSGDSGSGLIELEAQARHAQERYRLYRAKAYGPRLTSTGHLRQLEREVKLAENRLDRAKADRDPLRPRR